MIYRFLKYQLIIFFILISTLTYSKSEIVKDIKISGNERVNVETIKIFGKVSIGDDLSQNDLNDILKLLYETNFFKNIDIKFTKSIFCLIV